MKLFTITQNGIPLDSKFYTIDEKNKIFNSKEDYLVLDFFDCDGWTFNTEGDCIFYTGSWCKFDTLDDCTFYTGSHCEFETADRCIFKIGSYCKFNVIGPVYPFYPCLINNFLFITEDQKIAVRNKKDVILNSKHPNKDVRIIFQKILNREIKV